MKEKVLKQIEEEKMSRLKSTITLYRYITLDVSQPIMLPVYCVSPGLYNSKQDAEKAYHKWRQAALHIHIDEPFHYKLIGFAPVTVEVE